MSLTEEIREKLLSEYGAGNVSIVDDSEAHRGHGGYREGGESHFNVAITSPKFAPLSRIERHRAVHATLGPDIIGRIHALGLDLQAPEN